MTTPAGEPDDHHLYRSVGFRRLSSLFIRQAVQFTTRLIDSELEAIGKDDALSALLSLAREGSDPIPLIRQELAYIDQAFEAATNQLESRSDRPWEVGLRSADVDISHREVRLIKSACILYLRHLQNRRNALASRPNLTRFTLTEIDRTITQLEELLGIGVLKNATPVPLLVDELLPAGLDQSHERPEFGDGEDLTTARRPPPVVLDSIQILDEEVRLRCLDLLAQFTTDGSSERLDTVVTEAMRILENRLRKRSGADSTTIGNDLVTHAFSKKPYRLVLSAVESEQVGAGNLFRGVVGFIRNRVGHHLVDDLKAERALQILGMVDYLLHLIDTAESSDPPE